MGGATIRHLGDGPPGASVSRRVCESSFDMPLSRVPATPAAITIAWLTRLRWGAALGQTVTIAIATLGLGLSLPLAPLAALVAMTVISNAVLAFRLRRNDDVSSRFLGFVLAADIFVLSGLLYFSGGPSNPFSVMYLVHVTLAALVLGVRWAGGMVALSALLYALLFVWYVPVPELSHVHHQAGSISIHLQGMWVAFSLAAALIAYFVSRVAGALRDREADLARMTAVAARSEKLASLTTLAASAAHELGTPLATIAVAANELERSVEGNHQDALDDAHLIRTEVARCREIIQRMSAQAGETMGEVPRATTANEIFRGCLDRLGKDTEVTIEGYDAPPFVCPPESAIQVLLSLVHNAVWAVRGTSGRVTLRASVTPSSVALVVADNGVGIDDTVLSRIGEPFVTTKPLGEGMGLGLFLARSFAERWGGQFGLESKMGEGTVARLELPRAEVARA